MRDQDENMATIGEKTDFKGAYYRKGQPFIVEGDPHMDLELNQACSPEEKQDELIAERHERELRKGLRNNGAQFDYKDVVK